MIYVGAYTLTEDSRMLWKLTYYYGTCKKVYKGTHAQMLQIAKFGGGLGGYSLTRIR